MTYLTSRSAIRALTVALLASCIVLPSDACAREEIGNAPARLKIDESPLAESVRQATSLAPIVRRAAPGVVSVSTTTFVRAQDLRSRLWRHFFNEPTDPSRGESENQIEPIEGIGSGVIVSEDGYILTNSHVVEDADEIKVALNDGSTELTARVIGRDRLTDIAVLKVDGESLPAITIADSDRVEVGDLVLAIGNPFGVGQTVTQGIVSAKGRSGINLLRYEDFIQTDAPINLGNSGGALVDAQGRLVGINTIIFSRTGGSVGVGFAVPIKLARFVMDKIIRDGEVRRGYLGVELEEKVTPDLAQAMDLPGTEGALVTRVLLDGPSSKAGIEAGDFIVAFNGVKVTDRRTLQFEVAKAAPDQEATLDLIHDGRRKQVKVALGKLDLPGLAGGRRIERPRVEGVLEGVKMVNLTTSVRNQYSIPPDAEGKVCVTEVRSGTPAYEAGLREGCVILEANDRPVESVDEVMASVQGAGRDRVLLRVRGTNAVVRFMMITIER